MSGEHRMGLLPHYKHNVRGNIGWSLECKKKTSDFIYLYLAYLFVKIKDTSCKNKYTAIKKVEHFN